MLQPRIDPEKFLRDTMEKIALGARYKEVVELTESEKAAICYMAGVPMRIETTSAMTETARITTDRKVGIIKIEGKLRVLVHREEHSGDTVKFR